jgi:hypothetical protein
MSNNSKRKGGGEVVEEKREQNTDKQEQPTTPKKRKYTKVHGLTEKQRIAAEALAAGKSTQEAAELAGYAHRQAIYPSVLTSENVRRQFHDAFEELKMPVKYVAEKLKGLMDAEETVYFKESKVGKKEDNAARVRAVELAAKLHGGLDPKPFEGSVKSESHLHLHLDGVVPSNTITNVESALRKIVAAKPFDIETVVDVEPEDVKQNEDEAIDVNDFVATENSDKD